MSVSPPTGGKTLRRSSKRRAAPHPPPVELPSTALSDDPTTYKPKRIRKDPQPRGRKEKTPSRTKMSAPKRHLMVEEDEDEVDADIDADRSSGGAADEIEEKEEQNEEEAAETERPASPNHRTGVAAARAPKDKRRDCVDDEEDDASFLGDPVPEDEARARWPHRYTQKR